MVCMYIDIDHRKTVIEEINSWHSLMQPIKTANINFQMGMYYPQVSNIWTVITGDRIPS
jgi:hypothetical protein